MQWERSTDGGKTFQPIAGATSETYVIPSATVAEDGYRFRATWTNLAGSATSSSAPLTVRTIPVITEQPEPQIVLTGGTATFEAEATAHPATDGPVGSVERRGYHLHPDHGRDAATR